MELSFSKLLSDKLIQITHNLCIDFDFNAIFFFEAFEMSIFSTLHASEVFHLLAIWFLIVFETSVFTMSYVVTFRALDYVLFSAISSLMTNFVTFKAHFFITVKRFMGVFSAQNAVFLFSFIWATF